MKCSYHPDVEAIGACISCGRLVCTECAVVIGTKTYCQKCSSKLLKYAESQTSPNSETEFNPYEPEKNKAKWFERHLNWTFILALIVFYGLTFLGSFLTGFILALNDPYITDETLDSVGIIVSIAIAILFLLPISAWILEQKGRSLWNLLLLVVPFGLIIFLGIGNRRTGNWETNTGTDFSINNTRIRGKWVVSLISTISGILIIGSVGLIGIIALSADEPAHSMTWQEVESNPIYWNTNWRGLDAELQTTAYDVASDYFQTHTYIENETDCNDMSIDVWNMLHTKGITSVIVVGNQSLDDEYFAECDHAWLLVFNSKGYSFALEITEGTLFFAEDVRSDPQIDQYWEGYLYAKPSDLKADTVWRW